MVAYNNSLLDPLWWTLSWGSLPFWPTDAIMDIEMQSKSWGRKSIQVLRERLELAGKGIQENFKELLMGCVQVVFKFKLALERECWHIYEYFVGTPRITLLRGFLIGYGISRVGKVQIQIMNCQYKNNPYNLWVTANWLHFIALDSIGALPY